MKLFPHAFHGMRILSRLQTCHQQEMYSISYLIVTKFKIQQQDDQENNKLSFIIVLLINLSYLIVRLGFTHNCYSATFYSIGDKFYLSMYIFALTCSLLICSISGKSTNSQSIPSSLTPPSHVHVQSITNSDNSITHITFIFTLSSSFLCHFSYSSKNHQGLVALTERHPGYFQWRGKNKLWQWDSD